MALMSPRNLLVVALAVGVYVLAFRHGQMSVPRPTCECGRVTSTKTRDEEDLLAAVPQSERIMMNCMLERADTRATVRRRLHTCLLEHGALDPASAAQLSPPPHLSTLLPPPPPLSAMGAGRAGGSGALVPPSVVEAAAATSTTAAAAPAPSAAPLDPLMEEVRVAREAEEELPSTPLQGRPASNPGSATLALAAAATSGAGGGSVGRLVTITCIANGRLLTLEPTSDWAQCGGDGSGSGADLLDALFSQETLQPSMQLAYKHVRTGRYLSVVPPGDASAWVVRAHSATVGQPELWEVRSGRGGHTFLYNLKSKGHLNHRFGFTVRAHGDAPGRPAGRVPSARLSLQYYTLAQLKTEHSASVARALAAREPMRQHLAQIHSWAASSEVRVISYGLYGKSTRYTIGVLRNAQLAPIVYPGWKVRVYHDSTVPRNVIVQLERLGAQLVKVDDQAMGGGIAGMFWRFLVAADPAVDRFIIRDSDSRLNAREAMAVEEWIQSGKLVHSIRDHPNHDRPLNGGMWGGTRNAVPDMATLVKKWSNREAYMGDLDFLNQMVWTKPAVRASQMSHDAYSCAKYAGAKPFPTQRPSDFQHVGQVFFGDGRTRQDDIISFMLNRQAPKQCRGQPEWVNG